MNCIKEYEKMVERIKDRVEIELEMVDLSDLEFDLVDDYYSENSLATYTWKDGRKIKTNLRYFYDYLITEPKKELEFDTIIAHEIGHYIHEKYFTFEFYPQLQTLVFHFGDISNVELFAEAFSAWVTDDDRENEVVMMMDEMLSVLKEEEKMIISTQIS